MAKKGEKKSKIDWKIAVAPFILALILLALLSQNSGITGDAVFTPSIPSDCSDSEIKETWDSIFKESSSGITILSTGAIQGGCAEYAAFKNISKEMYILTGDSNNEGFGFISGLYGNFSNIYINDVIDSTTSTEVRLVADFGAENNASSRANISSETEASNIYSSIFNYTPPMWTFYSQIGTPPKGPIYLSGNTTNETGGLTERSFSIWTNISLAGLFYEGTTLICVPFWNPVNASCTSEETMAVWYNDTNACQSPTDQPSNTTVGCDFNKNGIIGDHEDVDVTEVSLEVKISNSTLNTSENYTGTKLVEFIDGNKTLIELDWNFATPLDFNIISIEKQSSSSEEGYVIVDGLEINKTLFVDQVSGSGQVCVKDVAGISRGNFSLNCTFQNEVLLNCPGSNGTYSCSIEGGRLKITGLTNSGALELPQGAGCTPSWNCTWAGVCLNGIESGLCVDNNFCGTEFGKPAETRSCVECVPDWLCTAWGPADCKSDEQQTRSCTDQSSCGVTTGKPLESRDCPTPEEPPIKTSTIILIVIALLVIGVIVAMIMYFLNKKAEEKGPAPSTVTSQPPGPPTAPAQQMKPMPPKPGPPAPKPVVKPIPQPKAATAPVPKPTPTPTPKPAAAPAPQPTQPAAPAK